MTHLGEEPRLEVRQPFQGLGRLVQLGIECDDPAIGLVELAAVHLGHLGLPLAQFLERIEQLLILLLEFLQESLGSILSQLGGNPGEFPRSWGSESPG